MKCKSCGNEFDIGIFCPKCGFKNEEESISQASNITESIKSEEENVSSVESTNQKGKGFAVASLIMGIISILTVGAFIVPEIFGIVFAFVSKKNSEMRGTAKAGLICSIISIVLLVLIFVFL